MCLIIWDQESPKLRLTVYILHFSFLNPSCAFIGLGCQICSPKGGGIPLPLHSTECKPAIVTSTSVQAVGRILVLYAHLLAYTQGSATIWPLIFTKTNLRSAAWPVPNRTCQVLEPFRRTNMWHFLHWLSSRFFLGGRGLHLTLTKEAEGSAPKASPCSQIRATH